MADNKSVSARWSDLLARRAAPGRDGWFYAIDHPRLREQLDRDYLGGPGPFVWVRQHLPERVGRALEIGCGAGDLALTLARQGICPRIDAFDVAEGAIAAAQARARDEGLSGLNFLVADGNRIELPPAAYDFIYANHALHHITDLEHLFAQCARALRPGGVLFASDYVGPSRMQYSDAHLARMNDALARLPPEKRPDVFHGFREKLLIKRAPLQAFLDNDPSEAPRSADILPALRRHFDVEAHPYGMVLSYEVLLGIVHNFDPDDPEDNRYVDKLLELDRAAEASGEADTLFANILARPRAAPPVRLPRAKADLPALLAAHPAPEATPALVGGIDGWLRDEAADLTIRLCHLQAALGVQAGVLELGVYRGKYLALLAALHPGLPVVGVDMLLQRMGEGVAPEHHAYFVGQITDAVRSVAPCAQPTVLVGRTQDFGAAALRAHCPAGYSFVSVDAGHEAGDVLHDLRLAAAVLSPGGIVALDDAFNHKLPGVSEGLMRYLSGARKRGLAPFAAGGNKLFLCQPAMHATCLAYARWLLEEPDAPPFIKATAAEVSADDALGFAPTLFGRELVGFSTDPP